MKIALYIEDGLEQIVLTPESETEKGILGKLDDGSRTLSIKRGKFFECRGGYVRHEPYWENAMYGGAQGGDESTMIVLRPAPPPPEVCDHFWAVNDGELKCEKCGEAAPK